MSIDTPVSKKRRVVGFLFRFVCVVLGLMAVGYYWEQKTVRSNRKMYRAPGQLVDLNGRQLHLQISGNTGPVVLFESGLGRSSLAWHDVASRVSKFARVVTYDRAGLGWSDVSAQPSDASHVVEDLHNALNAAGIDGPFILVGHSMGGLYVRLFSYRYPELTQGVVLIDSSHEHQLEMMPVAIRDRMTRGSPVISIMKYGARIGLLRIYMRLHQEDALGGMPRHIPAIHRDAWIELMSRCSTVETIEREMAAIPISMQQTLTETKPWGDLPLRVITAGDSGFPTKDPKLAKEMRTAWTEMQQELASRSIRSEHLTVPDSGHAVHQTHPEVIVQAIQEIIDLTNVPVLPQ